MDGSESVFVAGFMLGLWFGFCGFQELHYYTIPEAFNSYESLCYCGFCVKNKLRNLSCKILCASASPQKTVRS